MKELADSLWTMPASDLVAVARTGLWTVALTVCAIAVLFWLGLRWQSRRWDREHRERMERIRRGEIW